MRISDISIKRKMLLFYMITGIFPLIVVGLIALNLSTNALVDKSFNQLAAIQNLRKNHIEDDFNTRLEALKRLNRRNDIINLFKSIRSLRGQKTALHQNYITSPEYNEIFDHYAPSLSQFTATYKYQDLMLVTAEDGEIFFSIKKDKRLGMSLYTGSEQATNLAKLVQTITTTGHASISDFAPYQTERGHTEYVAYIGQPLFSENGKLTGIVIARLGPELIDSIVTSRKGMGQTGESYIIAYDAEDKKYEFRTTVHSTSRGRWIMGKTMPELQYWKDTREAKALGQKGLYKDSTGTEVLIAAHNLNIANLDWYLVSKINYDEVMKPVHNLLINILLVGLAIVVVVVIGAFTFARSFTDPLFKATRFAQTIASGQHGVDLNLERQDELGLLGNALDTMARHLRQINWMNASTKDLDDALRGEHNPEHISQLILDFISRRFSAPLAGVYITNEDTQSLTLSAHYGWVQRDDTFSTFLFGEGLVGQAARSNAPLYFAHTNEDTPTVDYGAGEAKPTHFVAVPLQFEGKTLGVVLIGAFKDFSEQEQAFLANNSMNTGILLAAAKNHQTIQTLLKKAQKQENALRVNNEELTRQAHALIESERELQTQQEELRVTNEELEGQARALRNSENELQSQQEELRVTNEELEERTRDLEDHNRDIQQKNAELIKARDEIKSKIAELETANKYKSEFLANMSHELRTPLNSILILSQLMAENRDSCMSLRQIESARTINSSGSDLLKLINDILDLSKVEAGKIEMHFEATEVADFVTDIKRTFDNIADDRKITFDIDIAETSAQTIITDPHRLLQVVRNLLSNAFKFTEPGKNVCLSINQPEAHTLPKAWKHAHDKSIAFHVTDQGIGIPMERQHEIFEAFRQGDGGTSRKYGGTGLGLSISRSLVSALGGIITLESIHGEGSTFTVYLPVEAEEGSHENTDVITLNTQSKIAHKNSALNDNTAQSGLTDEISEWQSTPEIQDDRKSISPQEKSILIIEDDTASAAILRDLAHERGFKCLIAEDGKTGLHFADYFKPRAILLDIGLPGIDGWEVMSRLKDNPETRHIPVHFISGTDKEMEALRMGAVGFLSKPITLESMNLAFGKIEDVINKPVSSLLIVEDDLVQSDAIRQLIGNGDVISTMVRSGQDAIEALTNKSFDCMILDLGLHDMTGFELLEHIQTLERCKHLPIIIYTGKELSKDEEEKLHCHAESIIIKGARSPERLLDESNLFLHRVESTLPARQRAIMRTLHDRDSSLKGKTVLLVDDDMRNVFAITGILEGKDINVIIARDGLESLEKVKGHPEIDLILMDIMMPEMDGYEAMREIRKDPNNAKLPILALTAKAMKGDRNICIDAGANDYLAKPLDVDKLLSLLRVWLYK